MWIQCGYVWIPVIHVRMMCVCSSAEGSIVLTWTNWCTSNLAIPGTRVRFGWYQNGCLLFFSMDWLQGEIYRKPWFLPSNIGVSCKFSHQPILFFWGKGTCHVLSMFQPAPPSGSAGHRGPAPVAEGPPFFGILRDPAKRVCFIMCQSQ